MQGSKVRVGMCLKGADGELEMIVRRETIQPTFPGGDRVHRLYVDAYSYTTARDTEEISVFTCSGEEL